MSILTRIKPICIFLVKWMTFHPTQECGLCYICHSKTAYTFQVYMGITTQVAFMVKNPPANAGDIRDVGSTPGSGSSPGGGHGNPLQCSCLENPMDRGACGLESMGSQRAANNWANLARMHAHVYCENGEDWIPGVPPDTAEKWLHISKQPPQSRGDTADCRDNRSHLPGTIQSPSELFL